MASKVTNRNKLRQKLKRSKLAKRLKKEKICKCAINYGPYLCRVLKKQDPKLRLSVKTTNILNSFGSDMLDRIVAEASLLAKYTEHKTINAKEIQSAVRLVLPPGLAREATHYGIKAVNNYYQSKKENCSIAMNEEKLEKWLKCYSKTKNRVYYWNPITLENFWDNDKKIEELVENPRVQIIDLSEEMKSGDPPVITHEGPNVLSITSTVNGVKVKKMISLLTMKRGEDEEDDDDEDDEDLEDSMCAFYASSRSSSVSGSQASFSKSESNAGSERRHSEPLSRSSTTKDATDRRKSMENPSVSIPAPSTSTRPHAKPLPNCGKRRSSDTSTSSLQPSSVEESNISLSKLSKKEQQKPPPQKRNKTPIQDRKMKEREALLKKHQQKNNRMGAGSLPDLVAETKGTHVSSQGLANGNSGTQNVRKFVIPKRKMSNGTPEQELRTGAQVESHRSPLGQDDPTPQVPYRVPRVPLKSHQRTRQRTETTTSNSLNTANAQSDQQTSDKWVSTVWDTPPPVLAEAVKLPMSAPGSIFEPVPAPVTRNLPKPSPIVSGSRPLLLPTPSPVVSESRPPLLPTPSPVVSGSRPPLLPTPPPSERGQETESKNLLLTFPKFIRKVKIQHESPSTESSSANDDSVKESSTSNVESVKAQETVISEFKDPSPVLMKRPVRVYKKRSEEKNKTNKAQEAVTVQSKDPPPFLIRRTMRNTNVTPNINKTNLDSNKESACVRSSPKKRTNYDDDDSDSSDDLDSANFKRSRGDSQNESTFDTSTPASRLSSDAGGPSLPTRGQHPRITSAQSSLASGHTLSKRSTPATRPRVTDPANLKRSGSFSDSSIEPTFSSSTSASRLSSDTTGPSGPSLPARGQHPRITSAQSSLASGLTLSNRSTPATRTGLTDPAKFQKSGSFTDSPNEPAFATSTPASRLSSDAGGPSLPTRGQHPRITSAQSSLASGHTLSNRSTPATRPGVTVPLIGHNLRDTSAQSTPSTEQTLSAIRPTPSLGSGVIDARQILDRRRNNMSVETLSKPCSIQNDDAMEWEPIEPPQGNVFEKQSQRSSLAVNNIHYKPFVIVCDTNALIHNMGLVEEMVNSGSLLGIPVKLVIPYQVFRELDKLKNPTSAVDRELDVPINAKAAIKLINRFTHSNDASNYSLEIQEMSMHKEKAKGQHLDLESNDDHVLNCALQCKEEHGDEKTVVLLTGDKHLLSHAKFAKIISQSPDNLKAWARDYKEKTRLQALGLNPSTNPESCANTGQSGRATPIEIKMEVDSEPLTPSCSLDTPLYSTPLYNNNESINSETVMYYANSLSNELLNFLKKVIDMFNERHFGHLKKYARPAPASSLVQCLSEIIRRWNSITDKRLNEAMNSVLRKLIDLVKKRNSAQSGKEVFTNQDMKDYFTSCQTLVKQLGEQYKDISTLFLTKLIAMFEEWEQKNSRSVSVCEDDPQPADMALQNIFNCMRSDYATYKEIFEREKDGDKRQELEECLRKFYQKVTSLLKVIRSALEDYPQATLSVNDECIFDFLKATTVFKSEDGNYLTFELTKENILLMFKENNLRKGVETMLEKIRRLQSDVMDLLEEMSSSDSDDDDL